MLKVSPWKRVIRFGKRGKLNPRYIGPFKILAKVGTLAYRLELPEQLSRVHNSFYVSNLKKCLVDEPLAIPLEEIQIDDKLNFIEEPVKVMDQEVKQLKQNRISIVKVRWNSRRGPEFTWEREDHMKKKYSLCVREVNVRSGLPATTSMEMLELLDEEEHILGMRIVGGDHRLRVVRLRLLLIVKESAINVPMNLEARRRITFFANSLYMRMPNALAISRPKEAIAGELKSPSSQFMSPVVRDKRRSFWDIATASSASVNGRKTRSHVVKEPATAPSMLL
ncbi:putative reverse transcriptase domain-containing protein [Tanacetum coccineum]|uniref:Reverse transcriptase domain-containing protein n=1 Tax=Tanacetum coccineum TaxID=301880 RepID=A0ABQ5D9U5_9ASTR